MEERIHGAHCLRAGANGFVSKNSEAGQFRESILTTTGNGKYISEKIKGELLNQLAQQSYCPDNPLVSFSAREITIMDMLLQGLWAKEIASRLNLKESSVSSYKTGLFEKTTSPFTN